MTSLKVHANLQGCHHQASSEQVLDKKAMYSGLRVAAKSAATKEAAGAAMAKIMNTRQRAWLAAVTCVYKVRHCSKVVTNNCDDGKP
jgi:hypothetical protein